MENKNLVFFNYFHNGDVHSGREFVKDIIKKTGYESVFFYHKLKSSILKDINLKEILLDDTIDNDKLIYEDIENIYINTWFHVKYGHSRYQCTLEALYYNFTIIYDYLKIKLESISYYIPSIDYFKYNIKKIDDFFDGSKYDKYIYVSNGEIESFQSDPISLDEPIYLLSKIYKNCLFILSNKSIIKSDNIILSKDIIGSNGEGDLNENSYITTKCDIIIGRESGPYFFSYVKENVTGDKKQFIIPMCHVNPFINFKYYNENKKQIWINSLNFNPIQSPISNNLRLNIEMNKILL